MQTISFAFQTSPNHIYTFLLQAVIFLALLTALFLLIFKAAISKNEDSPSIKISFKKDRSRLTITLTQIVIIISVLFVFKFVSTHTNHEKLTRIDFEKKFTELNPKHSLKSWASSSSFGGVEPYKLNAFFIVKGEKSLNTNWVNKYSQAIRKKLSNQGFITYNLENLPGIQTNEGNNSTGEAIFFTLNNSDGVLNIRYTTTQSKDNPDYLGYLTIDLIEFGS